LRSTGGSINIYNWLEKYYSSITKTTNGGASNGRGNSSKKG
jgi:hypothetical protein